MSGSTWVCVCVAFRSTLTRASARQFTSSGRLPITNPPGRGGLRRHLRAGRGRRAALPPLPPRHPPAERVPEPAGRVHGAGRVAGGGGDAGGARGGDGADRGGLGFLGLGDGWIGGDMWVWCDGSERWRRIWILTIPTDKRHTCMYVMQCGPILAVYDIPHIAQVHVYHIARLLNPDSVRPGYESLDAQLLPWYGMQCLVRSFVVLPRNAVQASAAPICVTQNHRTHFAIGPPSTSTASPFPPSRGR